MMVKKNQTSLMPNTSVSSGTKANQGKVLDATLEISSLIDWGIFFVVFSYLMYAGL